MPQPLTKKQLQEWSQRNGEAFNGLMDINGLLPVSGDIQSGLLAANDVSKGNYGSAALNGIGLLPFVPSMAGMVTGKLAKAIKPTKYEKAHEVARKNAVEMLGLPENNTAMDRARALGFDAPAYHGTDADVPYFDVNKSGTQMKSDWGKGVYLTPRSSNAEYYAVEASKNNNAARNEAYKKYEDLTKNISVVNGSPQYSNEANAALKDFQQLSRAAENSPNGANILPLLVNSKNMENYVVGQGMTDPFLGKQAAERGNSVVRIFDNNSPNSLSEMLVTDPSKIRSRFAAFDPARINEADLLGQINPAILPYLMGGGLLGAAGVNYGSQK